MGLPGTRAGGTDGPVELRVVEVQGGGRTGSQWDRRGWPRPGPARAPEGSDLHLRVCALQDEGQGPGFEARVVVLVESMIPRSTWRGPERLAHGSPFRGMSLLHLAAAQGYARLIETLSQWR